MVEDEKRTGWNEHNENNWRQESLLTKTCHIKPTCDHDVMVKRSHDRSCDQQEKKTKSISDIVEPLNCERLKPIRQKTRNAVVSITEDNEVCLEFLQEKENLNYVIEVLRISSNGMKITTYHPDGIHGATLQCHPAPPPSKSKINFYLYCSLPMKYWKKYQYAARFVDLVRKKTPKITLYTKLTKCMLMENSPNADFEACFYNGIV